MDMIHKEYTGHIPEIQGHCALTMKGGDQIGILSNIPHILAQFDMPVVVNGKRMDLGWHPFPESHFSPVNAKPIF